MKGIILKLISFYQKNISPFQREFSGYSFVGCKFFPSCSQYCKESIKKRGVARGLARGGWRILKCNPFSKGGVDLP